MGRPKKVSSGPRKNYLSLKSDAEPRAKDVLERSEPNDSCAKRSKENFEETQLF